MPSHILSLDNQFSRRNINAMNLTQPSREYYQCFQKQFPKPPSFRLSTSSKNLLKRIYNGIHARRSPSLTGDSDEPVLANLFTNPWFATIPPEIQREIRTMKHAKTYHLKIGHREIRVVLVQHMHSLDFCKRAIRKIERWLSFILSVCPAKCANTLSIYLCLTDHKKQLPAKIGVLYNGGDTSNDTSNDKSNDKYQIDTIHANTAFTTSCNAKNSIFIYRKEEWFKVLIHESFHCLGLDFSELGSNQPDQVIRSVFPALSSSVDVRLYESYCEMWAEIINLLFLCGPATIRCKSAKYTFPAKRKTQKMASRAVGFNCVVRLLKYERIYSVFQANKLLRHYDLEYTDLFEATQLYQEKTQAFSYYVAKSILMWNIDAFLQWCLANNSTPYSLEFNKKKVVSYANLVGDKCRDASYMAQIGESGVERCAKSLDTTMRMCLFEGM